MRAQPRREGRGTLSSMDLVPDVARDDILWALAELNKRERSQADILFELNDRLEVHGVPPISKSSFNRRSMRMAVASKRIQEQREVFAGIANQFTPESVDQGNLVLGQMIKTLIAEILDNPDLPPKDALSLARAYREIIQGQKTSTDHRQKLNDEAVKQAESAVGEAVKQGRVSEKSAADILETIRKAYRGEV